MMNEGLFRALQADREREIRIRLRERAMLGSGDEHDARAPDRRSIDRRASRQPTLIRARET